MSMDLSEISLRSEDLQSDGATAAQNSQDAIDVFSYILEDIPLPDAAATATTAVKAMQPSVEINGEHQSMTSLNTSFKITSEDLLKTQEWENDLNHLVTIHPSVFLDSCPSSFKDGARGAAQAFISPPPLILTSNCKKRERRATSTSSISSSDWIKDFQGERIDSRPLRPSLLASDRSIGSFAAHLSLSPPDPDHTYSPNQSFHAPPSPNHAASPPVAPPAAPTAKADDTPLASICARKRKRRKPRLLDETRAVEPTNDDVLFGRGPSINKHPGNVRFREKALEYHPWYMESSKELKEKITDLLVESVQPHRFLEKGEDRLWHEVIDGARYKASQTFRDISKYNIAGDLSKFSFQASL